MSNIDFGYDPAYRKLEKVIEEASALGVPESIISGLKEAQDLFKAREIFCEQQTSPSSSNVEALIQETFAHPWDQVFSEGKTQSKVMPRMLSGRLVGYVLKFLVSSSRAKKVLEVGMYTGCAALSMAEVLPEDGKLVTLDIEPYLEDYTRNAVNKSPHGKKIDIMIGPALDSMTILSEKGEKFDVVFIDANKNGYIDYCQKCLDGLLAPGGTIAVDNCFMSGRPYMKGTSPDDAIVKFNKWVLTRDDIYHVLLSVRDGVMLIRRKADMNG